MRFIGANKICLKNTKNFGSSLFKCINRKSLENFAYRILTLLDQVSAKCLCKQKFTGFIEFHQF